MYGWGRLTDIWFAQSECVSLRKAGVTAIPANQKIRELQYRRHAIQDCERNRTNLAVLGRRTYSVHDDALVAY
jgi:hypothetical protein